MDGFCGMEDWGLQAVVRGSSGDFSNIIDQDSFFDFSTGRDELVFEFPYIFDGVNICGDDELEGLYKPFYPAIENCVTADQISTAVEVKEETQEIDVTKETSDSTARADAYAPKYKRRKNQHKRVVVQVSAEGLSSDVWAWRKYGQKPIKGSPYPRSYYRCSSSKGCLARKQVEQSCKDPGKFIITYSAEHNHSQPTRRNSLAGTIRQKFPPSKSPNDQSDIKHDRTSEDSISGSNVCVPFQSQETLMPLPMDEDLLQEKCNQDGKKLLDDDDLIFNDEFFSGLEEFDGLNSEILPISCHSSTQQFPLSSCS